jgi:hypothetical protein
VKFSERYGYKPIRDTIQIESIDEPLRNGLWSLLKVHCWDEVHSTSGIYSGYFLNEYGNENLRTLCERFWFQYFKKPLDSLSNDWQKVRSFFRDYFFNCSWHEVYDFVEFVTQNYDRYKFMSEFTKSCNLLLEKEMSAYRFVNGLITQITEPQEVEEIEQAIEKGTDPVRKHLRRSLELLSDRNTPDYRNSIKESISAVESFVGTILKSDKSTLGQLIKKLEDEISLHPALKAAFNNLYGYTSDESGIRHALTEIDNVDSHDAKFMLVVCSAFINFVEGKASKAG